MFLGFFHEFIFDKGHYIYIEAKGNDNQGADKARIISPKIRGIQANDREAFCVVFWYYMFGDTVGELNVYLRNESSPNLGRPIWGMAGARGEKWRAAEVELNTPEDFYVRWEEFFDVKYGMYCSQVYYDFYFV